MKSFTTGVSRLALGVALAASATTAAQAATLEGRVTDANNTVALEGARVTVQELGRSTTTDRSGGYRFTDLPAGSYTVTVTYVGADSATDSITLETEASSADLDFALGRGGTPAVDSLLVVGQRGSLYSSLNQERAADNMIEVLSADAIGQFPDQNVAESVRRVTGVTVLNDQGEGRFVAIRGADPALNSTSVNGVRIPAPEGDTRAVALDVIDSDVLETVTITKSLTPDMDGDAIGGAINIQPLSAFDREGRFLTGNASGSYNNLEGDWGYKIGGAASDIFMDGKLGIAGSVSFRDRDFGSDNLEVDGPAWEQEDGIDYPEEVELRDYVLNRQRFNAALNFDYRPTETHEMYLRGLYSEFSDQEYRSRFEAKFEDAEFNSALSNPAEDLAVFEALPEIINPITDEELQEEAPLEFDRDIKDRLETQRIYSLAAGGSVFLNDWTIDYFGSWSMSEEEEPDRIDTDFRFETDEGTFAVDTTDGILPMLVFDNARIGGASPLGNAVLDPSNYEFDELQNLDGLTTDTEWAFGGDFRKELDWTDRNPGFVKFGTKTRLREKERDVDVDIYDGFAPRDLTLDEFAQQVDYGIGTFGPAPNPFALRSFFKQNRAGFELDDEGTLVDSALEDYTASEDIVAAYLMGGIEFGWVKIVGGFRYEHTTFDAIGTEIFEAEEGATVGGMTLTDDTLFVNPVSVERSYGDFLPSVNARWDVTDEVVLRAAYYRGLARPDIEAVVPAAEIEQSDSDELEAELGNPDLDRQIADSFDLSVDWYTGGKGIVAVGFFYKDIQDLIAVQAVENVTVRGTFFDEAVTALNLPEASLWGLEFNVQQPLDFLGSPLDGFIVGGNYTYVDGNATLNTGREIALPRQSEHVANVFLGYDKGILDVRGALAFRGEYIDVIDEGGAGIDRIVDDHLQWDLSAKVKVLEGVRVFAEATNISDEPFVAFIRQNGRELNAQYEEYDYTINFGVKVNL